MYINNYMLSLKIEITYLQNKDMSVEKELKYVVFSQGTNSGVHSAGLLRVLQGKSANFSQ